MTMRFGVIVFPGSNCDHDAYYVINNHLKCSVEFVWHKETNLNIMIVLLYREDFHMAII